jgi:hypothetical protein
VQLSSEVTPQSRRVLNLRLHHNGESPFKDIFQTLKDFTHEPRLVGFTYDYHLREITSPGTIGDETAGYANLSPFTHWTIDFGLAGNEWLNLDALDQITVTFEGSWQIVDG